MIISRDCADFLFLDPIWGLLTTGSSPQCTLVMSCQCLINIYGGAVVDDQNVGLVWKGEEVKIAGAVSEMGCEGGGGRKAPAPCHKWGADQVIKLESD